MAWATAIPIIGSIVDAASKWAQRREDRKQREHEKKMRVIEAETELEVAELQAKAAHQAKIASGEIELERTAMESTRHSWKDEYALVWVTGIFTAMFIPGLQPYIIDGFQAAEEHVPEPFWWMLGIGVTVSFGITQVSRFAPMIKR